MLLFLRTNGDLKVVKGVFSQPEGRTHLIQVFISGQGGIGKPSGQPLIYSVDTDVRVLSADPDIRVRVLSAVASALK